MLKEQLNQLKEKKKTSDLYEEPLVYFGDTEEMDAEGILDKIETKSEFLNLNVDRYMLTEKDEENFNRKFKTQLYEYIIFAKNKDYKYILDFLIRQYKIDKMNKTELLFLILPFKEYDEQIAKLMSAQTVTPNLISSKLHLEEILNLFKRYFDYQNLDYVYSYIVAVLDDYFNTHNSIKEYVGQILIKLIDSLQDKELAKKYYNLFKEKSKLRLEKIEEEEESGSSHIEVIEGKENVSINNIEETISKKRKVTFIDNMDEFKENITELNSDKILRDCCRPFVKDNIEEILNVLFKFSNINYSYILEYVNEDLIFKYVDEDMYLPHIINIASQKNISLKDKFIKNLNDEKAKYLLTFYEKINNKNFLSIADLDIIENYIIKSTNKAIISAYNSYLLNLSNDQYNQRVEFLIRHNKLAFIDTDKITDNIKNLIFKQPTETYFKNNLEAIINIVKNDCKDSSIVYFKSNHDRIDKKNLKEKLVRYLLSKVQDTGSDLYINILLCDDFIITLLEMLDIKDARLIYDAYILESIDYDFLFLLFALSLDNSAYIKKSINSFKLLYNRLNMYTIVDFLTCERLRNYIYNVDGEVSCLIFDIYHSNEISLLLYINDILPIVIDAEDVNLLTRLVETYKNILLPFIKDIVSLIDDIKVLSLFNVTKLLTCLNGELLIKYLQSVEMTKKIITQLIKEDKINLRVLYCIFYSKYIKLFLKDAEINAFLSTYIMKMTNSNVIDLFEDILSEDTVDFCSKFISIILMDFNITKLYLKYNRYQEVDYKNIYELYFMTAIKDADSYFLLYLLNNAKNTDFTIKVNKKLFDLLFERNNLTLIGILNTLYKKYQYYNVCIEPSLQHFKRLLEDDNEKIRRRTNELITTIKENSNSRILKMIYK